MLLGAVIEKFLLAKRAQRLSVHTLLDYGLTFRRFLFFAGDVPLLSIQSDIVRAFLAGLPVSKKTVLNAHTALSSLWTFAVGEGVVSVNVVRLVRAPKPEKRAIVPFTASEFLMLSGAVGRGRMAKRDFAILLLLLDTGVRASELCGLAVGDYSGSSILVFGKGAKERELPVSEKTGLALELYLTSRGVVSERAPLFLSERGGGLERHALRLMLNRLSVRSGVRRVYAHRLRHTFAITFLRAGGNVYALRDMLGHTSLDMCARYLAIAQSDLVAVHKVASPVVAFSGIMQ